MRKFTLRKKVVGAVALSLALASSLPALAMASPADSSWIQAPTSAKTITDSDTLLTTYGVRAGSAGGDYLGISNTNFDFTSGRATSTTQYLPYKDAALDNANKARLAIFGSDINENPNPYLYNLFYNANGFNGTNTFANASTTAATSWMNNPHSWGDTAGAASTNVFTGAGTVQGAEFGIPDIIYGATDKVCWGNFNPSGTVWYKAADDDGNSVANGVFKALGDSATYVHNDSSNVWTQIYTMGQLASTADSMTGTTRYGKAVDSAVNYEKAIKGNVLYVASKIDGGTAKKKVAYLYAIDGDASTAYFFTPEASKLTSASNTGKGSVVAATLTGTPSVDYGANNATVSIGYMDVLPFITDTYNSGAAYQGTIYNNKGEASEQSAPGIAMAVENYVTMSPACTLDYSTASNQLKDVDVIIYNTSTNLKKNSEGLVIGTSGGKNLSGIVNSGDYASGLTGSAVEAWAKTLGFTGKVIGGDDYGTSTNQPVPGTAEAVSGGAAPMLYCQRNYTADRDSRAAWAISQVYPELYGNNPDATYGYWVNKIYHVKTASVPAVVQFMTNDSTATTYDDSTAAAIEQNAQAGYDWWTNTGSKSAAWSAYAYYNGSSRASFIDTDATKNAASEEPKDTIGIFAPSALWTAAQPAAQPVAQPVDQKITFKKQTKIVKAAKLKKKKQVVKITKAKGANTTVTYSITKVNKNKAKFSINKKNGKITIKKGLKKGTYKVRVKASAAASESYLAASKTVVITIKVK